MHCAHTHKIDYHLTENDGYAAPYLCGTLSVYHLNDCAYFATAPQFLTINHFRNTKTIKHLMSTRFVTKCKLASYHTGRRKIAIKTGGETNLLSYTVQA